MAEKRKFVVRAEEAEEDAANFSHPWNPNSEIYGTRFSSLVGFSRVGVSRVKVPPGKESFAYHSHQREEEWIFIISGRGLAEIDGEEYEVGTGDFMGFPPRNRPTSSKTPRRGKTSPASWAAKPSTWTSPTSPASGSGWSARRIKTKSKSARNYCYSDWYDDTLKLVA